MGFESGMFQTGAFRLDNLGTAKTSRHSTSAAGTIKTTATVPSVLPSGSRIHEDCHIFAGTDARDGQLPLGQTTTVAEATTPKEDWDMESQSSQANIIKTTREWAVDGN